MARPSPTLVIIRRSNAPSPQRKPTETDVTGHRHGCAVNPGAADAGTCKGSPFGWAEPATTLLLPSRPSCLPGLHEQIADVRVAIQELVRLPGSWSAVAW